VIYAASAAACVRASAEARLGEDRQVGVQPNPVQPSDAQRGERPVVLPAELTLDGRAATVELAVWSDVRRRMDRFYSGGDCRSSISVCQ
jgi:hypothetical protein